ncbi:hypothetical protein S245_026625 [Arachis hypogaea]
MDNSLYRCGFDLKSEQHQLQLDSGFWYHCHNKRGIKMILSPLFSIGEINYRLTIRQKNVYRLKKRAEFAQSCFYLVFEKCVGVGWNSSIQRWVYGNFQGSSFT